MLLFSIYFQVEFRTRSELEIDFFTAPDNISRITICPPHRSSLGIGWKRGSYRCRVPEISSSHAHGKSRKAYHSKRAGIFIPVGSGK